ncbi:FadR/GntR family transcriptional regulator [Beijerinckia indica]|uniref:Pyruvate dehydrogenase complex repressor n=1 Tax=Beijerinckia indica subsp. indica (strain ATCC 9039 / DSM 1715 / NCIMB 8712) TaxID=395963 RepID=B2ICS5_BEII9|nr:FCD domain-containing protein [Beijerinckia indica]ACB95349.1 GntR domain protein [Beijerinckia indica subsp. indica ATCC 9039]
MTALIQPIRLADKIAQYIERLILEGVLRAGERLSSERDLAEKLGVSRPSLRDGIARLEQRGLLVTTKAGTFVADFMAPLSEPLAALFSNEPRMLKDYFEFRRLLEGQGAAFAAERATDIDREKISACLEHMRVLHELDDPRDEAQQDVDLHILIYEATHNLVLQHTMRMFSDMLKKGIFYSRIRLYERPEVRAAMLEQHISLATAILEGRPREAEAAAHAHIDYTARATAIMAEEDERLAASQLRLNREDLVAE